MHPPLRFSYNLAIVYSLGHLHKGRLSLYRDGSREKRIKRQSNIKRDKLFREIFSRDHNRLVAGTVVAAPNACPDDPAGESRVVLVDKTGGAQARTAPGVPDLPHVATPWPEPTVSGRRSGSLDRLALRRA